MKKKLFVASLVLVVSFMFTISSVFAANVVNNVRNAVDAVEDTAENAAGNVGNVVKNGANTVSGATHNVVNATTDGHVATTTHNNTGYTATRTSTTFAGMTSTAWTWSIIAVLGVAIVALVWYYARRNTSTRFNNDYDDDE